MGGEMLIPCPECRQKISQDAQAGLINVRHPQ